MSSKRIILTPEEKKKIFNWDLDMMSLNKYYSICWTCDHLLNSSNDRTLLESLNKIHLLNNKNHRVEINNSQFYKGE